VKRVGPKRLFCHNDISFDESHNNDISHSMCENKNIIIKKRLKVLFLCNRKSKNKNKKRKRGLALWGINFREIKKEAKC
jgi:hypothetical protein